MNYKKYIFMNFYPFYTDPSAKYYSNKGASCYDMDLLGNLLSYLRIEYKTHEGITHSLQNKGSICGGGDLDYYCGIYNSDIQILEISGEYPDFMDQKYFENLYPKEKDKDFLEYTYSISLDNFLELAKKMIDFFHKKVGWIIIYEDEQGKVHLKEFDLENKKMIDDNRTF